MFYPPHHRTPLQCIFQPLCVTVRSFSRPQGHVLCHCCSPGLEPTRCHTGRLRISLDLFAGPEGFCLRNEALPGSRRLSLVVGRCDGHLSPAAISPTALGDRRPNRQSFSLAAGHVGEGGGGDGGTRLVGRGLHLSIFAPTCVSISLPTNVRSINLPPIFFCLFFHLLHDWRPRFVLAGDQQFSRCRTLDKLRGHISPPFQFIYPLESVDTPQMEDQSPHDSSIQCPRQVGPLNPAPVILLFHLHQTGRRMSLSDPYSVSNRTNSFSNRTSYRPQPHQTKRRF
ncbi:hypothetical protein EJ04DRAFT_152052 [Polyplosphaeria fusca]|uniref:NHR domain-containing protein n=1 Tax=Polyplosphaeria fusca TaxID=682080 RepID=A0A9P4QK96_9PLEO|nr:hypothetical protein EJ04DRAFT_152052 [Polyplosphaeria fusca]